MEIRRYPPGVEAIAEHLARERPRLVAELQRNAGWLLRHESAEDLAQGVVVRVLEAADGFEDRGDAAFRRWLRAAARQHLADRARYWKAGKRDAGRLLRLVAGQPESGVSARALDPSAPQTGPVSFAVRREMLEIAFRALRTLSERDRELVRLRLDGVAPADIAERLGLGYDAAQRGALRAQERFARAFRFLAASTADGPE